MRFYKVISNKLNIAFWDNRKKQTYYTKDNIFSYRYKNGLRYSCQYVADELITESELKRFYGITPENITQFPFLEMVEIPKNKTHWAFGCRFADDHTFYYNKQGKKII